MTFKKRFLQEDQFNFSQQPTLGQKIKEGAKNNWGKMLGAGALGALATTAAAVHNDDFNDTLSNWHELDSQDKLTDHFLSKGQAGLEHLKTDDAPSTSFSSGSSTNTDSGASNFTSRHAGTSNVDLDKLKAAALPYAKANDNFGMSASDDVGASDLSQADIAKENLANVQEKQKMMQDYQKLLNSSLKDGYVDPQEQAQIEAMRGRLDQNNMGFFDRMKGMIYGDDRVQAERHAEQQLKSAYDWAKANNLDFLTKGSVEDDLAFFRDVQAKFGQIPPQLQPIYQNVMRNLR